MNAITNGTILEIFINTYATSGMAWAQAFGCVLCMFAFFGSNRKQLWVVLMVHAVTGFLGMAIENFYTAQNILNPAESKTWAILLLINEINWIAFEFSTVIFSAVKLMAIIESSTEKWIFRTFYVVCLVGFSCFRGWIGWMRYTNNTVMNPEIMKLHSYAFIFWALAELVLFVLLIKNTIHHIRNSSGEVNSVARILFKSSIPRLMVIVLNTIAITIVGQFQSPQNLTDLNTVKTCLWMIKGTYPLILLFDIQSTKNMLISTDENDGSELPTANSGSKYK
jgi:hypothetical protein